jgi:hypothetical protein
MDGMRGIHAILRDHAILRVSLVTSPPITHVVFVLFGLATNHSRAIRLDTFIALVKTLQASIHPLGIDIF